MKAMTISAFAWLLSAALANTLLFLVSSTTSLDAWKLISALGDQAATLQVSLNTRWGDVKLNGIDTVVDVLRCQMLSMLSAEVLKEHFTVLNFNGYEIESEVKVGLREEEELQGLSSVVSAMGIKLLCVIASVENLLRQEQYPNLGVVRLLVATDISTSSLEVLIRKQAKSQGLTSFLVLLPPLTTRKLLAALGSLYQSAVTVFLTNSAAKYRFSRTAKKTDLELSGPLFLEPASCEGADNEADDFLCGLQAIGRGEGLVLRQMANGKPTLIGHVRDIEFIEMPAQQLLKGTSNEIVASISFSMNSGLVNPSGSNYNGLAKEYACSTLAVADVNSDAVLLPDFSLQMNQLSLGVDEFNETWAAARLRPLTSEGLGVAMLTGSLSNVAIGVYKLLESLKYELPQIGSSNTVSQLSSPRDFPLYTRVIRSNAFLIVVYGWLMQHYNWDQICVVYENDTWSLGMYRLFVNDTKARGIEIANEEQYRMIPEDWKSENFTAVFKEVVRTRVRIVVVLSLTELLRQSFGALYDLGMRSGDLVFLGINWLQPGFLRTNDSILQGKITELCQGAVMVFPAAYVGTTGQNVLQEYRSAFNATPSSYCCYYYDAVLLLAHALDSAIVAGQNYQSARVLSKALRSTRFKGCSGQVTIEDKTNDRSLMPYSIFNARMYEDRKLVIEEVGTYDPASVQLLNFTTAILWPGNSTISPTSLREFAPGCPFEAKHVTSYPAATALSCVVLASVSASALIVTAVFRVKYWRTDAKALPKPAEASFEDYFVFFRLAAQAVQHSNFGPKLQTWALLHQYLGGLLLVRLDLVGGMAGMAYWAMLTSAMGVVGLWTILLILGRRKKVCRAHCIVDFQEIAYLRAMPLLGELCFLPILSTLLSIFQCPKVVLGVNESRSVQQAFLLWDCHLFCWTKEHIAYIAGALACLVVYIPSAVYLRPVWQHLSTSLHVYASPKQMMSRSMYEIVIVLLEKTMRTEMPLIHGVLFILVTILFLLASLHRKAYGYSRANLWQRLSVVSVLCVSVLTLLARALSAGSFLLWMCVYLGVLLGIAVFGAVYQLVRLPAMLYTRAGHNVTALFRFMLSRGSSLKYLSPAPLTTSNLSVSTLQARRRLPIQFHQFTKTAEGH